jgi:AsmA protein
MRALKWAGALLGGALLLAAVGMVAFVLALDAGALTPRLLAAIEGATGRRATLGAVSLRPGLVPRLAVEGATLANIEGGSRPEMARIRRIEANIALLPLLRGEVAFGRIALDGADILLERLADGRANWAFAPRRGTATAAPAPAADRTAAAARRAVSVAEIVLTDSRVVLPDARLGTIAILRLTATGVGAGGPVGLDARLALHGTTLEVEATSGPVPPPPGIPWPLRVRLAAGANSLAAEGAVGGPFALTATLPEPAALLPLLAALVPDAPVPPLLPAAEASLTLDADLAPREMRVRLGAADLGALVPGLLLTRLEASLPHLGAPAEATAEGSHRGLPFRLALRLDAPAALLPGAAEPALAIAAELAAGGATANVTGRIARPRSLEGAAFELRLAAPDLGALAAVLPDLPPLREVAATARLAAPGRLDGTWRVAPFSIASTILRAEGDVTLRPGRPVGLEGRVAAGRIDLDALGEALARRQAAQPRPTGPADRAHDPRSHP